MIWLRHWRWAEAPDEHTIPETNSDWSSAYNGGNRYTGTSQRLNIPPFRTFCSLTINNCNDTNDVIGKWSPSLPSAGLYDIQAFIPSPGATTTYAPYEIWSGPAAPHPDVKVINQNLYSNEWVDLGKHPLVPGATVKLHSAVSPFDGGDIAYSAILFVPVIADHSQSVDTGTASSYSPYTFKGWGTSLAWWANVVGGWSAADRQTVEQQLFLPADASTYGLYRLGLNVVRYNIGASPVGSLPQNCPGLRTGAQVPTPKQSSTSPIDLANDPRQVTILNEADTTITGAGVIPHYEAFANSPPWWMTISGCPSGNAPAPLFPADNLSSSQYQAYADYLAGVVSAFATASHPIVFDSVEPFNEPASNFGWPSGGTPQEGANFATSSQDSFFTPLCAESWGATQISVAETSSPTRHGYMQPSAGQTTAALIGRRSCLWNTRSYFSETCRSLTPTRALWLRASMAMIVLSPDFTRRLTGALIGLLVRYPGTEQLAGWISPMLELAGCFRRRLLG